MKRQVLMNVMMAVLVAGLLTMVSCSKPKVASPDSGAYQGEAGETDAERAARLEAERLEAERLRAQQLQDQQQGQFADAKSRFLNQNVLFDFDSSALTGEAKDLLREKADWLQANPSDTVMIEGHCDDRGTTVYNLALGERRANAARTYLVDLGVSADRLSTVSYGEEKPLDPASNEEAYRINRRAQFVIK
ncbi:MAG TPA: peptidoglycan-associated lipoprotein Pal [Desulfobacter sp.]|jgi:peptidoglycan-associated lipoprotein|uniref:peptidoglycan-associated lipoprotein Pal n=1 Tax=Desulfobacter sp. UBA2225 TaxID=1961413 RepID=UPI000E9A29C5|nr:peptidoglycan-associated lipoprotein Pal [Desulfobacter sp. UBA2225]HAR33566.1 peptidoglycan-associated lipoprotein Pal [Desulfobacter sp.]